MNNFKFVELCAGIGGVSFAFEELGGKCVLAAEYDPEIKGKQHAQEAYRLLHPDTPVVGNVFELDEKDVPDHDVLAFTPPCQSFSITGKRQGFNEMKGTVVFECLRIANYKKPKYLLMENVKGLVNHDKGKTLETILCAMNEIGYVVDYEVLNSVNFETPHNRERVFVIGIRKDLIENSTMGESENKTCQKYKKIYKESIEGFDLNVPSMNLSETKLTINDILDENVEEYFLKTEKIKKIQKQIDHNNYRCSSVKGVHCINPRSFDDTQTRQQDRVYISDGYMTTLQAQLSGRFNVVIEKKGNLHNKPYSLNDKVVRRLTPRECLKLQKFPHYVFDVFKTQGIKDEQVYKFAGNAVTVSVVKGLMQHVFEKTNIKNKVKQ